jgi:hypothetical protein
MVKAGQTASSTRSLAVGAQVKVSTRVLPLRVTSTQSKKLMDKYLDPYQVIEGVNPGAYRFKLPEDYVAVPDIFNESDLRPYFDPGAHRDLDLGLANLPVQAHPALDKVVQVLDRKSYGRVPKGVHILDIPAQYLCVRKSELRSGFKGGI